MLCTFLESLLHRSKRFSDELLAAALECLLCAPMRFVSTHLPAVAACLTLSLGMGHAYPPLASAALTAIEALQRHTPSQLRHQLPSLLPALQAYLTASSESAARSGVLRRERDARRHRSASSSAALTNSARSQLGRPDKAALQQQS